MTEYKIYSIFVQLPGNRKHKIEVTPEDTMLYIKNKISLDLKLNPDNWGIFIPDGYRLNLVDDIIKIKEVDKNKLHFYPKAVIR